MVFLSYHKQKVLGTIYKPSLDRQSGRSDQKEVEETIFIVICIQSAENAMAVAMMVNSMAGGVSVPARKQLPQTSAASGGPPIALQPVLGDDTMETKKPGITVGDMKRGFWRLRKKSLE